MRKARAQAGAAPASHVSASIHIWNGARVRGSCSAICAIAASFPPRRSESRGIPTDFVSDVPAPTMCVQDA